ncbi:calcium-binding protein [Pseudogemmobacter bohemicus]|uniref:calcium-binding protein n=1 Tax=Pseudogemmobacter bohemicus TaxID=2250708 RepID=UPI0018E59142|nr:calcium-binding protein [Pseudogemmobacter bohemicus]
MSGALSFAWGDIATVAADTTFFGGNDTFDISGITVATGHTRATIYGDAALVAAGATARGGDDVISALAANAGLVIYGDFGTVQGNATYGNDIIVGSQHSDIIYGDGPDDTAEGGNDTISSGGGADTIYAGGGDDLIAHSYGPIEAYGGAGFDTLDLTTFAVSNGPIVVDLEDNSLNRSNVAGARFFQIEAIIGTFTGDDLRGDAADNLLSGAGGNDTLTGRAGNDTLDGGTGADRMYGGIGDDLYYVDHAGDQVTELADEGTDTVISSVNWTLSAHVENLQLTGSGGLTGFGNALANEIQGSAGNDLLRGAAGNDTLFGGEGDDTFFGDAGYDMFYGGLGNDIYYVNTVHDVVIEAAGEGTDLVASTVSWTLGAHIENLILRGSANLTGIGNEYGNKIIGNDGNNVLDGAGGNDYLAGGAGDDMLIGGDGMDLLFGGAGADVFVWRNAAESAVGTGRDQIGDFAAGDLIDLSAMDADSLTEGNQAFTFIGHANFSGVAGQLNLWGNGSVTILQGDLDGDRQADFQIMVSGVATLSETDFLL